MPFSCMWEREQRLLTINNNNIIIANESVIITGTQVKLPR